MKMICFIFAVFIVGLVPATAHSCTCLGQDPAAAYKSAQAVFVGEVLRGTEDVPVQQRDGSTDDLVAGSLRIAVSEVLKGTVSREVTVQVASMVGTTCGPYGLAIGEKYLIYAARDREILSTGVCSRTRPVDDAVAAPDLQFLHRIPRAKRGRIAALPEIKLEVGSKLPAPYIPRNISAEMLVDPAQTWPFIETYVAGIKYTIAFDEKTRIIKYIFTNDKNFRTTNGLGVETELTFLKKDLSILPYSEIRGPKTPDGWYPVIGHDDPLGGIDFVDRLKDSERGTMTIEGFSKRGD